MATEDDLKMVKEIILTKLEGYPVRVFLFGSQATGAASVKSDIDVAVLSETELPVGLLSQTREALADSNVPFTVDFVDISVADNAFRQRVMKEGVEWTA